VTSPARAHLDDGGLVPSGALARVSGTPSSLLNDRSLAVVGQRSARAAAHRSFTEVLPTDPVMPTTRGPRRLRASRPMSSSALAVSATSIRADALRRVDALVGQRRDRAGGDGGGDVLVAVTVGDDRHEQLPAVDEAGVDGDAVDVDVGPVERAGGGGGDVRGPEAHGRRSWHGAYPPAMPDSERIRLVVLFGGRSAEHEVSCTSAYNVLAAADRDRYDVVPIGITREGHWVSATDAIAAADTTTARALPSPDGVPASAEVEPLPTVSGDRVVVLAARARADGRGRHRAGTARAGRRPVRRRRRGRVGGLHGQGAGQGGARRRRDPPMPPPEPAGADLGDADALVAEVESSLGWPAFVKPANLGSSVGVTKVHDASELAGAVAEALRYDEYLVIEEGVTGREIEVAVLGNERPGRRSPGRSCRAASSTTTRTSTSPTPPSCSVPAPLGEGEVAEVQRLAVAAYKALQVDGMARVDFFYEEGGAAGSSTS
jgi:D-alanine-D-alanine ligase